MLKVKVLMCEYWYKTKQGVVWYKAHFKISDELSAWVPCNKNLPIGSDLMLRISRNFDDGRAKVTAYFE